MSRPLQKTTWVPAWAVCYDGTRIEEFRVSHRGDTFTVRAPDQTRGGGRWSRGPYERRFGTSRQEAIEKFRRKAADDRRAAQDDLALAEAYLERAETLAALEAAAAGEEAIH